MGVVSSMTRTAHSVSFRGSVLRRRFGANLEDVVPTLDQDLLTKELNYIAPARSDFVCSLGKNLRYRYLMLSPTQSRFRASRTSWRKIIFWRCLHPSPQYDGTLFHYFRSLTARRDHFFAITVQCQRWVCPSSYPWRGRGINALVIAGPYNLPTERGISQRSCAVIWWL